MIVTLLYSIAGGMLGVLATATIPDIAWRFIRLVGLLCLAMACIATAITLRDDPGGHGLARITIAFGGLFALCAMGIFLAAPISNRRPEAIRVLSIIAGMTGVPASVLANFAATSASGKGVGIVFLQAFGQVFGCWLLGSITLAWLLGHAYLTATKMTIAPFRFFSNVLSAAVIARLTFLLAVLGAAWLTEECSPTSLCTRIEQWWIIVLLRVGVGLVAVGVFAYMVRDCVRLRSTQSATGILYFASAMAYVGELASVYLTRELGWPI